MKEEYKCIVCGSIKLTEEHECIILEEPEPLSINVTETIKSKDKMG